MFIQRNIRRWPYASEFYEAHGSALENRLIVEGLDI